MNEYQSFYLNVLHPWVQAPSAFTFRLPLAASGTGGTAPDPAALAIQLLSARSTFSPALSTGPLGSTASFTLSTARSMLSPVRSAGPFSLQETTEATNGSRQNDTNNNGFMIR